MAAQANGLPPVPSGLSPDLTARLTKERAQLVSQGDLLQAKVEKYHAECAYVETAAAANESPKAAHSPLPVDTALLARCEKEQPQIQAQVRSFAAASAKYRKDIEAAIASTAGPNALSARVVLKGGVQLVQPTGQATKLTSSRVVVLSSGERVVTSKYARASFQLTDGTQFIVGPEADVVFKKVTNGSSSPARNMTMQLTKGTIRWVSATNSSASPQNISIDLASANVNVGGASMQASVSAAGDGYITAQKGSVAISPAKSGSKLTLRAGEIVTFSAAGTFGNPGPIQSKQVQLL